MTRVLLVDDHAIVRSGVRRVLEATGSFEVVGESAGAKDATSSTSWPIPGWSSSLPCWTASPGG